MTGLGPVTGETGLGVLPTLATIEAADHAIEAHCTAEIPVLAVFET